MFKFEKKGHWGWLVNKKNRQVKIAHSEEMDGEVGWGKRCWQPREGSAFPVLLLGLSIRNSYCTPAGGWEPCKQLGMKAE